MKFRFFRRWALGLSLLALVPGCSPARQTSAPTAPTTANTATENVATANAAIAVAAFPSDDLGRPVALKAPAERVIAISPGAVETVFALGASGQLVGRDDYASVPPAASKIAVAGNFQGPNVEQCIALRPDLVIVQGETYDRARAEDWQSKIGAPVAILTPRTLGEVRQNIEKIGVWLGKGEAAHKLAATLQFPASPAKGPTAFIQIGQSPLYSAGRDTLVGNVIEAAGFRDVAPIKGYAPYNVESLLAAPPDFYIAPSDKPKAQVLRELRQAPALSKLQCVREGRVIVVNGDLLLRPGPRLKEGIEQLKQQGASDKAQG